MTRSNRNQCTMIKSHHRLCRKESAVLLPILTGSRAAHDNSLGGVGFLGRGISNHWMRRLHWASTPSAIMTDFQHKTYGLSQFQA